MTRFISHAFHLSVHYIIPPHPPPVVGLLRHPSSSPPEPEAAYGVRWTTEGMSRTTGADTERRVTLRTEGLRHETDYMSETPYGRLVSPSLRPSHLHLRFPSYPVSLRPVGARLRRTRRYDGRRWRRPVKGATHGAGQRPTTDQGHR